MAITNQEQQQIIALTVGLFDAAPGAQYLEELTAVYEANNNSLEALADFIIGTPAFNAQYAGTESQEDIIGNAVELFGVEAGTDAYAEAVTFFEDGLANGRTEASLLVEAAAYLGGDNVAPAFADIATKFQNKVEVATYLSVEKGAEEGDIAALKATLENVTEDAQSVEDAKAQIDEDYPEDPEAPEGVAAALQGLQDANEARATFLTEEALASELVLAETLDGETYETIEEALAAFEDEDFDLDDISDAVADALETAVGNDTGENEGGAELALDTARTDVAAAVGVLDGLDDAVDYSPENDQVADSAINSFDGASRNIQDTIISESQAVLTEVTEAAEAAVSEVTGLSGRIATLQTRKAEFEATLEADFAADAALDNEEAAFNGVNDGTLDLTSDDASITFEEDALDGFEGAILTRVGDEWSIVDNVTVEDFEGIDELLADVQAAYDANQANSTAEDRFQTAIERVVEAERGDDFVSLTATVNEEYTIDNAEDGEVSLNLNSDVTEVAPLSQALIDLRESQVELDDALANLEEARELSDTLEARNDDITAAEDVFGEEFDLNLKDDDSDATAENDLYLFEARVDNAGDNEGQGDVVDLFGEQGQDHIFFGNTDFQLVELVADETIEDRVGSADQLEVFWQQNGANLELFVESEAAAGTDAGDAAFNSITKVTLTEFNAEDIASFEDGLLSTAPVEVA